MVHVEGDSQSNKAKNAKKPAFGRGLNVAETQTLWRGVILSNHNALLPQLVMVSAVTRNTHTRSVPVSLQCIVLRMHAE